jgi:hypothetical protein
MTKTTLAILKWLKGPIAIVSGLIGTWLYTNIPGLHVFGNTAAQTGKWVDGVIVFGITAGATYLAHDHAINVLIEDVVKVIDPAGTTTTTAKTEPAAGK